MSGKPVDIPSANPTDISNHKLEILEIYGCDSIKSDIEEDQSPLEESVDSVGFRRSVQVQFMKLTTFSPPATL